MRDLADEDPEAAAHFAAMDVDLDKEIDVAPEEMTFWRGWHDLRNDRPFGAMGGAGGIYYTAISTYCRDHEMAGAEARMFTTIIRAMDDEYLAYLVEEQKKRETENKPDTTQ